MLAKSSGHAAHQVRHFAVRFHGLSLVPAAGSGSFHLEHGPKVQKFKKERCHNAGCPKTHIVALVIDGAGLLHLHKASLFQQDYGPFTTPLTDAGITDDGSHVYVDETILYGRRSKAKRGKVKMGEDCFNDNLASLPAF